MSSSSRGYELIRDQLQTKRLQLKDRLAALEMAERIVVELTATCNDLKTTIADLEHDQRALDRGYIAIMGDIALNPSTKNTAA